MEGDFIKIEKGEILGLDFLSWSVLVEVFIENEFNNLVLGYDGNEVVVGVKERNLRIFVFTEVGNNVTDGGGLGEGLNLSELDLVLSVFSDTGVLVDGEFIEWVESLLDHPLIRDELGEIVSDIIGENNDDILSLQIVLLAELDGGRENSSGGSSAEHTLTSDDSSGHGESHMVINLDPVVNNGSVEDSGNEIVADSLHQIGFISGVETLWEGEDRSVWVNSNDLAFW